MTPIYNGKRQTSVYLLHKDIEKYNRLYPKTLSSFLQKAVNIAVHNPEIFYKIYAYQIKEN